MGNPSREHWDATKWLLKYLKGIADHELVFREVENATSKVFGFIDLDFASDLDKKRSVTGFMFILCGGAVS